eukprot:c9082_g1_i2.p1 GENE.c9082_g1_i2~~c9082_g1_i2.p1  ORF type:complete len:409 (+),score=113.68 c9082_g1_i2:477-1703(+)
MICQFQLQGQATAIKWFIDHGADPMARGLNDYTALHYLIASPLATPESVQLLLSAGASPSVTALNMLSPCALAIESRKLQLLEILLAHKEKEQDMPYDLRLHVAAMSGDVDLVNAVLKSGVDPNCRDPGNSTPLHVACYHDQADSFLALLAAGSDPTLLGQHSLTCAHICSLTGAVKCLGLVAKSYPTQIIARDPMDFTPLHIAAQANQPAVIDLLLAHGADVNDVASNELGPVHMAAMNGNDAFITELLNKAGNKVNISKAGIDGLTPLHIAAMAGKLSTLKLLVKAGADVNAASEMGQTPIEFAQMALYQADARLDPVEAELETMASKLERGSTAKGKGNNSNSNHNNKSSGHDGDEEGDLLQDDQTGEPVEMQASVQDLEQCCSYLESLALKELAQKIPHKEDLD